MIKSANVWALIAILGLFNIKLAYFNSPLDQVPYCIWFAHGFSDRLVRHYYDGVSLEVWTKFS